MLTSIPESIMNSAEESGLSEEEAHKKCSTFYVECYPNASWQHLSGRLYQFGEVTALEKLKPFLPSKGKLNYPVYFMGVNMDYSLMEYHTIKS